VLLETKEEQLNTEWEYGWRMMKAYMVSMVDKYPIGQQHTRFAVVGFGTIGVTQLRFSESTNADDLKNKINAIELISLNSSLGARNTSDGYLKAYQEFASSSRSNVPKYAIFVALYAADKATEEQVVDNALLLQQLNVYLWLVPMIDFKYDEFFQKEIADTNSHYGVQFSAVIEVNNYEHLFNSSLTNLVQTKTVAESQCGKERCVADIAILVDQSTTITSPTYYQYVVPFLKNITQNFDIGPDRSHLAMVRFCTPEETGIVFDFNFTQTLPAIFDAIDKATYCAGTTAMET